jgi:hypothetical protein
LIHFESPNYKDVSPDGLFPKRSIARRPLENPRAGICRSGDSAERRHLKKTDKFAAVCRRAATKK